GQSNFYRFPNSQFVQPRFSYAKVASYDTPFSNYPIQNNQQRFILNKGKKIPQGSQNPKLNPDGSVRKEGHNPSLSTQQSQTASQSPQTNISSSKQNVFEQRIAKLEQSAQQYIAQVSSLSIQITNLQQQFIAYQQETNNKLDQIYAAIRKEDSDDSPLFVNVVNLDVPLVRQPTTLLILPCTEIHLYLPLPHSSTLTLILPILHLTKLLALKCLRTPYSLPLNKLHQCLVPF